MNLNFWWRHWIGIQGMSMQCFYLKVSHLTSLLSANFWEWTDEQMVWKKVYERSNVFFLSFFSFYTWLKLLLAKLERSVFLKFAKDIQIHDKTFNKTRSQFSNKEIHHWHLTRSYEIEQLVSELQKTLKFIVNRAGVFLN